MDALVAPLEILIKSATRLINFCFMALAIYFLNVAVYQPIQKWTNDGRSPLEASLKTTLEGGYPNDGWSLSTPISTHTSADGSPAAMFSMKKGNLEQKMLCTTDLINGGKSFLFVCKENGKSR